MNTVSEEFIESYKYTEGCEGEQSTLEFDLPFGDALHHKLVKTYKFKILIDQLHIIN